MHEGRIREASVSERGRMLDKRHWSCFDRLFRGIYVYDLYSAVQSVPKEYCMAISAHENLTMYGGSQGLVVFWGGHRNL